MNLIRFITVVVFSCLFSVLISAGSCQKKIEYKFMAYHTFDQCEGKDSRNFTLINQYSLDKECLPMSPISRNIQLLLSCSPNSKQTNVNMAKLLASQNSPNGAYINIDELYLLTSGSLEGKYVYLRSVKQLMRYLKSCFSILGQGYGSFKSNELLISDKLDLNVLISPTGAFELFKKGCTTICQGTSMNIGPTQIIKQN